jgi:tRNA A37 threonylcarbamoyladenosine dehydratase
MTPPHLQRLALITGAAGIDALAESSVMVVGLGGVGSWCAEALVRSGIGRLCIADSDSVCITNINRQVQATSRTIGQLKTEALRERLLEINPKANIEVISAVFAPSKGEADKIPVTFPFASYRFIIDAIDSLSSKLDLIETAFANGNTLYSSMGMAQKLDAARLRTASIWQTYGCPLARLVRQGLRKRGFSGDFTAVFSDERLPLHNEVQTGCGSAVCLCPKSAAHEWCSSKKVINGSAVMVTAAAGMILASLVVQDILKNVS